MKWFRHGIGPLLGGMTFSIGLGMGGMTEPENIIAFLDVFGDWKPDLLFVMGGGLFTYGILYRFLRKRERPLFEERFYLPTRKDIDVRLIAGSALFGVGWGIAGLCPGPALVSLVSETLYSVVFVLAMIGGMGTAIVFQKRN